MLLVSFFKYHISQFVCTNHLFAQHQNFIAIIDAIKTPTSIQEVLKDENWVQSPTLARICNNLMLKMSSFMETWKRKYTRRFPQDSIHIMI
ncbi:hypothetical protein CR513_46690, partial [Mucuna pruriens]